MSTRMKAVCLLLALVIAVAGLAILAGAVVQGHTFAALFDGVETVMLNFLQGDSFVGVCMGGSTGCTGT